MSNRESKFQSKIIKEINKFDMTEDEKRKIIEAS